MCKPPLVSVVMATYNRENQLKEALNSVLSQTYSHFECIIIDDCSKDSTPQILKEYAEKDSRIKVIRNVTNQGLVYNLNLGFAHATGKYLARLDDDDICVSTRFEKQVEFLENNNDIDVLASYYEPFGEYAFTPFCESDSQTIPIYLHFFCCIGHPTVMIRKEFLDKHHLGYNPQKLYAEDYDLWKEVFLHGGKFAVLPEFLLHYRCEQSSVSFNPVTRKLQQERTRQVQWDLMSRFFPDYKSFQNSMEEIITYPLEYNDPYVLYHLLEYMRKNNKEYLDDTALVKVQKKYCPQVTEASYEKFLKKLPFIKLKNLFFKKIQKPDFLKYKILGITVFKQETVKNTVYKYLFRVNYSKKKI